MGWTRLGAKDVPSVISLREFRHSIANVAWVVFGMVDILIDQHRAPELSEPHPVFDLARAAAALRLRMAPLFEMQCDGLEALDVRGLGEDLGPLIAGVEEPASAWCAEADVDPHVVRSLAAVLNATADLRRRFTDWNGDPAG